MAVICLVTPGHLSTNPRIVKEARALTEAGHVVRVVSCTYSHWGSLADEEFRDERWAKEKRPRFGPGAGIARRLLQRMGRNTAAALFKWWPGSRISDFASHDVTGDLLASTARIRADLYLAHYVAALPAAARAARRHGGSYAFDAEDFHLGDAPEGPRYERGRAVIRAIEARYLPSCAYVTAASPGIADAYAAEYGIARPTVVLNTFPLCDGARAATAAGTAAASPSVYWFSQTIGPNRGLEGAVRAIGLAKSKPHLYLRGAPAQGYVERLYALAQEAGSGDRLHILASEPPGEMARLASAYDLGLSLEPGHTRNNEIALGNKLFSYLLGGLPIVASATPAHIAFASELEGVMSLASLDDPAELALRIDELLLSADRLAAARAKAFQLGQTRFNWEVSQAALLGCVRTALAARRTAP